MAGYRKCVAHDRWFLYPREEDLAYKPDFDPEQSQLQWQVSKYPAVPVGQRPLVCDIGPGEALYFPTWCATIGHTCHTMNFGS
jgi:hypothetical protein